jgi:glycosyltransferase involved in cell wall biosynthesis
MKILYAANIRLPTEKAHGAQITKTCEAFAKEGVAIELAVTSRSTSVAQDVFEYYALQQKFPIHRLWSTDSIGLGAIGFRAAAISFAAALVLFLRSRTYDVLYSRDEMALCAAYLFGHRAMAWESHAGSWNMFARFIARRAPAIVVITEGLKDFYVERGIPASKIHIAHDAVDLANFIHPQTQHDAKARLGLPQEKKIALYIGRLDGWKGADTFCAAASYLPDDVAVVVIGAEPRQLEEFSKRYPKVVFIEFRPYRELADNQAAADVLVLPNTGKNEISVRFTSPLKLFTYMASGRPIVASDLPSIREVLSEKNAVLVTPDDPEAMAKGVRWCLDHPDEARARAEAAGVEVERYTWRARATGILAFLNSKS